MVVRISTGTKTENFLCGTRISTHVFCEFVCFAALSIILSILTEFQVFAELHKTTCAKKYSKQSELPLEFIRFGKK